MSIPEQILPAPVDNDGMVAQLAVEEQVEERQPRQPQKQKRQFSVQLFLSLEAAEVEEEKNHTEMKTKLYHCGKRISVSFWHINETSSSLINEQHLVEGGSYV